MYSKLFIRIVDSSIWMESNATRLCWLTCLAVMDEDGFVSFASVSNLAHRARVSLKAAQAAVECLEGPDPNSSDPENEGRRLERVPGGWMVLNAKKYAALATSAMSREQTRERVRRHRARRSSQKPGTEDVTACNAPVTVGNDQVTPLDRDRDRDGVRTAPADAGAPPAGAGPPTVQDVVELWNSIVTAPIPKVRKLTADRKRKIEARLKTYPDLENWRTCIVWLNRQAWCRASGTGEHGNWTATFDYLIRNDGTITQALEKVSAEGDVSAPSVTAEPARPPAEGLLAGLRQALGDEAFRGAHAQWRGRVLLLGVGDPPALDAQRQAIETCVVAQAPDAVVEVVQVESVR